ncbi:hypothetical protein [Moraxella lacunata]|nr:hypothetical protein [Moraxella lacunata]
MKNNIKTSRVFMLSTLALFMTACSTIPKNHKVYWLSQKCL